MQSNRGADLRYRRLSLPESSYTYTYRSCCLCRVCKNGYVARTNIATLPAERSVFIALMHWLCQEYYQLSQPGLSQGAPCHGKNPKSGFGRQGEVVFGDREVGRLDSPEPPEGVLDTANH